MNENNIEQTDWGNWNLQTISVSVSTTKTKTKTYEVTIDTNLIFLDKIYAYAQSIDAPDIGTLDDSEIALENKDFTEKPIFNLAKIIAYMKMKFGTIPVLSEPNGISIVEVHDNKRNDISEFVMDKNVTDVKFMINECWEGE